MILAVDQWPLALTVAITVTPAVIMVAWWLVRRRSRPDHRLAQDAEDPYRRWVQNVFLLVTTDCDYAHLPGTEARRILAHWWDVYGPLEHRRVLQQLAQPQPRDHAWDLVRFILVSRLGVAAGMLPPEVSWAEILPVARRLQAAYPNWRAMAHDYVQARRQWRQLPLDGSDDDQSMIQILDNLARLHDTRWQEQAFDTALHPDEPGGADV